MAAEEPLDKAVLRFAAIIESSDVAIYSQDLNGIVISWNRASEALFGYTAADVIGRPVPTIPPERRGEEEGVFRRIRAGQGVQHYETVRLRKDGARLHVSLTVSPIRNGSGDIIGASKIAHDITAQRVLEHDARRLAAIVESSDDAIISKDLHGTITSWNRGAERIFGYMAAEIVGRPIRDIVPAERWREEVEIAQRVHCGESVKHFETVRRAKDGTLVPISLTVSPVRDTNGVIIGAAKISHDITEQRRAAERAAFLGEAGAVLAGSLDYQATLTAMANLAVPVLADWCAVDVVSGGTLDRIAVAHSDPSKIELARRIRDDYEDPDAPCSPMYVTRTGVPLMIPEVTDNMIVAATRGDQERIRRVRQLGLVSYLCVPLLAHGHVLGALTLVTAESGRSYTEDDLRFAQEIAYRAAIAVDNAQALEEAQLANRLKDEFLATLSHELRTPLNAILGYSRMLRSGKLTAEKKARALHTVERNASALAQIVEDILDVSRIVSGKVRLQVQPVEMPTLVKDAVDTIQPAADAKGVQLETAIEADAGPIAGDPDRLLQVVWNLVSNGVKFTPRGGQVRVQLRRIDRDVEIAVSDTGIGIRPEFLPHIFERFRQGDAATTREHGGLGLGLAIVRHLVELHGGLVRASSDGEGRGTTFRVTLPLMNVHAAPPSERRRRAGRGGTGESRIPTLRGIHVLAVDDDCDALALVVEILEGAGAQVTAADAAQKALDGFERIRPDVLVADVGMAGMDGYELIARVRKLHDASLRAIPAAALTAYARSEDRVKSLQTGFQMHLSKPIDPGELITAVAALATRQGPD